MNLQEIWNNTFEEDTHQHISKETIMEAIQNDSQSELTTLKKKMRKKIYWGFGCMLAFIPLVFIDYSNLDFVMIITLVEVMYLVPMLILLYKYQTLKYDFDYSQSVLPTLKKYYNQVKEMLKLEEVIFMFLYPFFGAAGMCFSLTLSGRTLEDIFTDSTVLLVMFLFTAIAVPMGTLVARKMNKKSFGKSLNQLQEYIHQLEELKR